MTINNETKMTPEALYFALNKAGLKYHLECHEPLMTVQDAKALRDSAISSEGQIKNLFVHNKKKDKWLLTLHEDRKIDLKKTAIALNAGRFSFCNSDKLMHYLGVEAGAVSPFGLLNDVRHEVTFCLDEVLLSHTFIHLHPLDNRYTLTIKTLDLLMFLKNHGHDYHVLSF